MFKHIGAAAPSARDPHMIRNMMTTKTALATLSCGTPTGYTGKGRVGDQTWMRVGDSWYTRGHRIVKHTDAAGVSYEMLSPGGVYAGDYPTLAAASAAITARARRQVSRG